MARSSDYVSPEEIEAGRQKARTEVRDRLEWLLLLLISVIVAVLLGDGR